jgi:peptidyl-prolyl cis-trans isomerase D
MSNEQGPKPVSHTKKHVARLERERQQTRLILYLFSGLLAAVVLLLVYGYVEVNYLQLNKPVATVNGVEISAGDFEGHVRLQRTQLLASYEQNVQYQQFLGVDTSQQQQQIQYYLNTPGEIGKAIIDQLVNEEIIRQEAAKMGITVSAEELEEAIKADFGYYPGGTPTPTIVPTEFATLEPPVEAFSVVSKTPLATATLNGTLVPELTSTPSVNVTNDPASTLAATATLVPTATATLAASSTPTVGPTFTASPTSTPYTLDGYQNQYATTVAGFDKFGMSDADYRKFIEMRLLQEKIKDVVATDVTETQPQVWARHILVGDQALALTLIDRLNAGEDFAELAIQFSTDTGSGVNGGDLGWFGSGDMVPEFETAAFALEKSGDFTQTPVQSQFGFHIIQLIAKQDRPINAEEIASAREAKFTAWLATTRETYTVVINDEFWRLREPKEPNFITQATEVAETSAAFQTEQAQATETPTPTP